MTGPVPQRPVNVLSAISWAFNLSVEQVTVPARKRSGPIAEARRVAARMLRDDAWLSWVDIAELLGLSPNSVGELRPIAARARPDCVDLCRRRLAWWQS